MAEKQTTGSFTAVYVSHSDDNEVRVYHLGDDGGMDLVQTAPFPDVTGIGNASPLVLARGAGRLYAGFRSPPRKAICWSIDRTNGRLTHIGNTELAANPANLSLSADEKTLFSVSFSEGLLAVNPIDDNGLVLPATQCFECGLKSHAAELSPDGKSVIVAALGIDRVRAFAWDSVGKQLSETWEELFESAPGSGPRHLIYSLDGEWIYMLNQTNASVDVFSLRPDAPKHALQTLTLIPEGFDGKPLAADIAKTPDGRFVYATERGSNTISGFRTGTDGLLAPIGRWPGEREARAIAISPDGRFLIVAGTLSAHLTIYAIGADGMLEHKHRIACGNGPNWIEMLRL